MEAGLNVYCAGAVKSIVTGLAQAFEGETGSRLQFTFGPVGGLRAKAVAGGPADILVLTRPVLEEMALGGKVLEETITDLGRVRVGVAVRADAAVPDVSTADALRGALLAAKSLAYGDPAKGDSSGIHFAKVLERLELGKAVGAKTVLAPLGLAVAELVESGEVEMGVTQASVILACKGTKLAGLLPAELQHATTYAAAMMAGSGRADEAKRFLAHIASPAAKSTFKMAGFDQNV